MEIIGEVYHSLLPRLSSHPDLVMPWVLYHYTHKIYVLIRYSNRCTTQPQCNTRKIIWSNLYYSGLLVHTLWSSLSNFYLLQWCRRRVVSHVKFCDDGHCTFTAVYRPSLLPRHCNLLCSFQTYVGSWCFFRAHAGEAV